MLNGDRTALEVYVLHLKAQPFTYTAAQPKQEPDKEAVSKIGGRLFKVLYFTGL